MFSTRFNFSLSYRPGFHNVNPEVGRKDPSPHLDPIRTQAPFLVTSVRPVCEEGGLLPDQDPTSLLYSGASSAQSLGQQRVIAATVSHSGEGDCLSVCPGLHLTLLSDVEPTQNCFPPFSQLLSQDSQPPAPTYQSGQRV